MPMDFIVDTTDTGPDESAIKAKAKRLIEGSYNYAKIATPLGVTLHERSATVTYVLQDAVSKPSSSK
jgi:hypothetical protein